MYKALAAYAAALISRKMAPLYFDGSIIFGYEADDRPSLSFSNVTTFSVLGALRYAYYALDTDLRPYNTVHSMLIRYAGDQLNKDLKDLTQAEAYKLLLMIAKG